VICGEEILCFAPGPWDDIWRNRHQLFTRLARENKVLWVEPRSSLRRTLRRLRNGQLSWREVFRGRVERVRPNLYIYHDPIHLPLIARSPFRELIQRLRDLSLRRAMRRLKMSSPILWLFLPGQVDLIGRYGEKLVIYHVVDEYSGYAGINETYRAIMRCMEERLLRRADLVFVTSEELYRSKSKYNSNTYWVPNAVDYPAFEAVVCKNPPPPNSIADLSHPLVGYVGAINAKVNLELLRRVALEHPKWSFVLVGPVRVEDSGDLAALKGLRALTNVRFIGRVDVTKVPEYIYACDVCLLPYKINPWTEHINSLKLYEYMACGRPIVATDIPIARRYAHVVRIAEGPDDFGRQIELALDEDNEAMASRRRAVAAENTWDQRVEMLSEAIVNTLARVDEYRDRYSSRILTRRRYGR